MFRGELFQKSLFWISFSEMLLTSGSWSQRGKHSSRHHILMPSVPLCHGRNRSPHTSHRHPWPQWGDLPTPKTSLTKGGRVSVSSLDSSQLSPQDCGRGGGAHYPQTHCHPSSHRSKTRVLTGRKALWRGGFRVCNQQHCCGSPDPEKVPITFVQVHLVINS